MTVDRNDQPGEPGGWEDDEYAGYGRVRQRRLRIVAWVVIVAMVLVGGGATVLSLLFG